MPRGHLDLLDSTGFYEGWACDDDKPTEPLSVSVVNPDDEEMASGHAHLYRPDLAAAKCGVGWCFFRLRSDQPVSRLRETPVRLFARQSRQVLFTTEKINYLERPKDFGILNSVEEVAREDPTFIKSVDQLAGCQDLFDSFISLWGIDAFVRRAYVYVLGRPADVGALELYVGLIRNAFISPFTMIRTLAASAEFRSRTRTLVAPSAAGFPFLCG